MIKMKLDLGSSKKGEQKRKRKRKIRDTHQNWEQKQTKGLKFERAS
jgi:hypothetical protein